MYHYRILATSGHSRDYVMKSVNRPLQFATEELAKTWIENNKIIGVEYTVKEMMPRQLTPMPKIKERKNRKPKMVSLEKLIEMQMK